MLRLLLFPISVLVLSACAQLPASPKHFNVNPEFVPFLEQFEQDSIDEGHPIRIDNLNVKFKAGEEPFEVGSCNYWETPTIFIDPQAWIDYSTSSKELLVYHELGHCILQRDHLNELRSDGMPKSIMNWYIFEGSYYEQNRAYYVHELFNP